jgi:hypothetical protein
MIVNTTDNLVGKMASHCNFYFISLNDREHVSMYSMTIYISSFAKCQLKLFAHISVEVFTFSN